MVPDPPEKTGVMLFLRSGGQLCFRGVSRLKSPSVVSRKQRICEIWLTDCCGFTANCFLTGEVPWSRVRQ
jgi:hypothetical protein